MMLSDFTGEFRFPITLYLEFLGFCTRTKYRLCEVFMPTARQSFYMPDGNYQKRLAFSAASMNAVDAGVGADQDAGSYTPLPNDFEREFIFCGSWSPSLPTPGAPSMSPWQSPFAGSQTPTPFYGNGSPVPWTPASPPPPIWHESSPSPPVALSVPDHWILHPKLVGIPIRVDISGGELETSKKKDGVIVETVSCDDGLDVICRRSSAKTVRVPYQFVQSFRDRPNPAREKGLMVIARNHPEHIGKLARRIHHLYVNDKTEENHWLKLLTVDRSGPQEEQGNEVLDVHPHQKKYLFPRLPRLAQGHPPNPGYPGLPEGFKNHPEIIL